MNNRATAQYTDAKATNTSLVSTSTPVDDMILPTYVPIDNLEVLKGAGKLGWGALQIVGSGFYNSGVRAIGGLGSIPYLLDGLDAAVAVQENFNADYSWQPQSEGANFIAENALAPVGEKVGYGLQIARNYSEDYIGDTATSLIIGGAEFGLEAGGLLSGTAGIRRALTKAEPNANVLAETLEGGATNSVADLETISVYRKMSGVEANATLDTMMLQPPIKGTDSSKYLSESLSKVEAFQNKIVTQGTDEHILEFVLDKQGYDNLMINAVPQAGSKGVNAIKFHYEGLDPITNPNVRNIGIPESMLDEFNRITLDIRKLKNGN